MKKKSLPVRTGLIIFLGLLLVGVAGYLIKNNLQHAAPAIPSQSEADAPENSSQVATPPLVPPENLHKELYEVGGFGPDAQRLEYVDSAMILEIPRLAYEGAVLEGMSPSIKAGGEVDSAMDETRLDYGVVLFNQAWLPGVENRNVSIAGHRDIHGKEFYYIDTITEGDMLYLYYNGIEYQYLYQDTVITDAYDWDYVATSEYSTLTLQSCDPINVATERIFVYAHLVNVRDLSPEEVMLWQEKYPAFSSNQMR